MEFCPKCGVVLTKKGAKSVCSKCGYSKEAIELKSKEKMAVKKEIAIIKDEDTIALPVIKAECPKCGHDKAYFWSTQTRGADESETSFFKCVKCKHTWRQYT